MAITMSKMYWLVLLAVCTAYAYTSFQYEAQLDNLLRLQVSSMVSAYRYGCTEAGQHGEVCRIWAKSHEKDLRELLNIQREE